MAILELVITAIEATGGVLHIDDKVKAIFKKSQSFEKILGKSLTIEFQERKESLKKMFNSSLIQIDEPKFVESLNKINAVDIKDNESLVKLTANLLSDNVYIDSFDDKNNSTFKTQMQNIALGTVTRFWILINNYQALVNAILISNTNESIESAKQIIETQNEHGQHLNEIIKQISSLSASVGLPSFNADKETATPVQQKFDNKVFINPFALVRAEDFNHNYKKLATLFQSFPEWESVQSRTTNVFIVGGRGTGKSMILRRMSIQTVITDYYNNGNRDIQLSEIKEDYYGIYIKLTRGTFDQYENKSTIPQEQANLLAQHQLNLRVIDAFRDSIDWLMRNNALFLKEADQTMLVNDLSGLFTIENTCRGLSDLDRLIKEEQKAINNYFRDKTFELDKKYAGSASDCSYFITRISEIFRKHFCNDKKDFRLILLIDEYEALAEIQQKAINNIIKNRLPDLTIKLAMRKDSIKTRETFTREEPIQEPRDFSTFPINYEAGENKNYKNLLKGICAKRLKDSGYSDEKIEKYLVDEPIDLLYDESKIKEVTEKLFDSSPRREGKELNKEFYSKYRTTAMYRIYSSKNAPYPYFGFDQFSFLSFGIISNFLELCKYTFYFALSKEKDIVKHPAINLKIQSHSVYYVSEKLFNQIDGNVPQVGPRLKKFLTNIGEIIRTRMLKHTSETECNRIAIINYDEYTSRYKQLPKVINKASTWSVIDFNLADESMGTKNIYTPKSNEIIINRIYCPHLSIPTSSRWAIRISADDLEGLLGEKSEKFFKKIISEIVQQDNKEGNTSSDLFNQHDSGKN